MVRHAEPVPPSRLQPKVPRDLETICLKCLEKEPAKRYATAALLGEDLQRFQSRLPIRARPTPVWERVGKWVRRHPAASASIGLIGMALIGLTAGGFVLARHEARRAETETELREHAEAQERIATAQKQIAQEKQAEAEREHGRAEHNFVKALEAVDQMLTRVGQEKLANEPRMERIRRDLLQKALDFYQSFLQTQKEDPVLRAETGRAQRRVGDIQQQLGAYAEAEAAYRGAIDSFRELAAKSPERAEYREHEALTGHQLAVVLQATGRPQQAEELTRQALAVQAKLAKDFPQVAQYRRDLASTHHNLGMILQLRNELGPADQAYGQAQDLLSKLTADHPEVEDYQQELARTFSNRGALMHVAGKPREAEKLFRKGIEIQKLLVSNSAGNPDYEAELGRSHRNLAVLLQLNHRFVDSEKSYQEAGAIFSKLADRFPAVPDHRHELATNCTNLSQLLQNTNHLAEALKECQNATDLLERLAQEVPGTPIYRQELARSLDRSAVLLVSARRQPEAKKAWMQAIDMQQALSHEFPDAPTYRQELARSHGNLAILEAQLGRLAQAEEQNQQAIALLADLAQRHAAVPAYREELIVYQKNLANLFTALDRKQDAERMWREILDIQSKQLSLVESTTPLSQQGGLQSAVAATMYQLAQLQLARNQLKEAQHSFNQAITHQRAAVAASPGQTAYRKDLCNYDLELLAMLVRLGNHVEAERSAAPLEADARPGWSGLPRAVGLVARCMSLAQSDAALSPESRKQHVNEYGDLAMVLLRRAIAGGYQDAAALRQNAELEPLRSRDDFKRALAELEAKEPNIKAR
jgi:tetratricopeptide (TPR) repeat protein